MPQKAVLAAAADDRKKAKSGSDRKPGERVKIPTRKAPPGRQACEMIAKDDAYSLIVGKAPGNTGTYCVERREEEQIEFFAKRLSDYDTPVKDKEGKIVGRRPRAAKEFAKFDDIIKELKGKDQKWVDNDAPQGKGGYRDEDMIKEPFVYRSANEVWPTAQVVILSARFRSRSFE
jgi:hypothetical protein